MSYSVRLSSSVTGGGGGQSENSDWEISADLLGKIEAGKKREKG